MFERLGSLTYRLRFAVVAAWILAAVASVLWAPSLASEGMTDQTAFLPADSASVQARAALDAAFPGSTAASSATLSFSRAGGLTEADRGYIADTATWVMGPDAPSAVHDAVTGVRTASTHPELAAMLRSDDGQLELMAVDLNVSAAGSAAAAVVSGLRDHLATTAPAGMDAHVTGTAGISTDYLSAIVQGTDSTTLVTVALVVIILLLIYRAPLAALVPLVTIGAAFLVSRGALGVLAAAGWKVSSLLDTFIVVLVFGVGTDYAIFLISRFREEVGHRDWHEASRTTVRRIGAVISASAATVIVGLGSMAFAQFGMIQTTGPALAVAVFVTLIAGLTLAPAMLAIFGHYLFWPLHARVQPDGDPTGFFARLAGAISKRPGVVTVGLLVVLLVPAMAMGGMRTNFDVLAELPAASDARAGFDQVAAHLGRGKIVQSSGIVDAGAGSDVLTPAALAHLRDLSVALVATDGVESVTSLVSPNGDGVVPEGFRPSAQLATMADGFTGDATSGGATADAASLLDPAATDGLSAASEYLASLATAYPDVASRTDFRTAVADLTTASDQIAAARKSAVVSTQVRTLARAMTSSTAAAGGFSGTSVSIIGDYLDELATEHPGVGTLEAYATARAAATKLERHVDIATALDLSTALTALADEVDSQLTGVTMTPTSLAGTDEAKARKAEMTATFDRLSTGLASLSAVFAARSDDVFVPAGLSGETGAKVADALSAFVSTDRTATRFYLTTTDDPYSPAAFASVREAQRILAGAAPAFGPDATAHLGGPTAEFADVETVLASDFQRVALITVIGIFAVLVLLLRAVVAPLYLVGTVLLSCATALGLSTWLFQTVLGQSGVSFYLPLLVFVLLVALGSDYNIFLMSRVREEAERLPIRDAIRTASGRTGAVITSAGLILAGTFGSMATAELAVLFQVGVAVALGVLIDTFLVRSILVPAITTLVGDRAWWPSGIKGIGALRWPVVIEMPSTGAVASARPSRRQLAVAIALVALIPMVVAGALTWSLADPTSHLDRVTAAVVDLDEGATTTAADGTTTPVSLGADLAAGLTAGADGNTFTWHTTDAAEAADGLAAGRYGAVLTIPADFSRTISAIRSETTPAAKKATIKLATNDASSYLLGPVARSLSAAIAASTAQRVTAAYVDDVLLSVGTAQGTVARAADDASALASGSTDVAESASGVSTTAGQLVTGLEQLAAGTTAASKGVGQLATGVDRLAAGTRQLASGASTISDKTRAAANGTDKLAAGASSLATGLDKLSDATAGLPAKTAKLADGAAGVATGAKDVASGASSLAGSLGKLSTATAEGVDDAKALDAGASDLAAGAKGVASGTKGIASGAADVADGASKLAGSVDRYTGAVAGLADGCAALGGSDALCAQLGEVAAGGTDLDQGAASLAAGADDLASNSKKVASGAADLAGGAGDLATSTGKVVDGAAGLHDAVAATAAGADKLASGSAEVASGAALVADGTATLSGSASSLAGAVSKAASGAQQVAGGTDELASGLSKLADGADSLASGAGTTAGGAARLADGTASAASGASKLATGVADAVDGAGLVAAGAAALADDGHAVADDAGTLATGLAAGSTAMPTYDAATRQSLGDVVADPVTVEGSTINAIHDVGSGLAPYFMALALWIGGLALALVLPAIPAATGRRDRWPETLGAFVVAASIGAAAACLMVAALTIGVGVEVARLPELVAFAILVMVTVIAVVGALVVVFGARGWLVALLLMVVQLASAGAWYPVETAPAIFGLLHPWLPMTAAVDGFRTLVAGGGPSLVTATAVLLAWLAASLVTVVLVTRYRAGPSPAGLPAPGPGVA